MRRRTPQFLGLTLVMALSTAGCHAAAPVGSSQAPLAPAATSVSQSPPPTPSEAMTAGFKLKDVQEAEQVYRKLITSYWRTAETGDQAPVEAALNSLTDPPFKTSVETSLKYLSEERIKVTSGRGIIMSVAVFNEKSFGDSVVALEACSDERGMVFLRGDGATTHGRIVREVAYFHRTPIGTLRYFANQDLKDTEKCFH